ncbi:Galactosylgalactosylxylosylprotein 3-beta-glucuronosyltransferase 1 [Clonorchis sinensis]|uniref:Galactosylgalactosylxylosylprotein 3-beta-glucuronosyltransferase n=1 Tax=Clonorchis sinensis TaxID=79923 RepID=A0A8T1MDY5_CLOSI|nr:Galactosylgalactosylxylosylprotein 3-beta-glucuronosyltransferase 1 [Clonorchis sinensis]
MLRLSAIQASAKRTGAQIFGRLPVLWWRCMLCSFVLICATLFLVRLTSHHNTRSSLPRIYILTATYPRPVQRAELTRLCNTLKNVINVYWIVCEDSATRSKTTIALLSNCGIPFTYLNVETPFNQRPRPNEPYWSRPKGISQRNLGLRWIRETLPLHREPSVLYIADDDNTYSLEVFEEMRYTRRVSTWPVGLSGELPWEGCVTSATDRSRISQMWVAYKPNRPFPIDMAGFAVNMDLILNHPQAKFDYNRPRGFQESEFLAGLGLKHWSELEPKADGCQKILVWHTRTADPSLAAWRRLQSQGVVAPPIRDLV